MYSSQITRLHPAAFIILIDRSGSMSEKITGPRRRAAKSDFVASATNLILSELVHRSRREEGIRDYFDLAVLGYSGDGVESLISPKGKFARPSILAQSDVPLKTVLRETVMPDGNTLISTGTFKSWIQPKASGNTPMYAALQEAYSLASGWCNRHSNMESFPPVIFNITDGEASDCDSCGFLDVSDRIKSLATNDGNVLLLNIHISSGEDADEIIFPASPVELPLSKHASLLYEASSVMPECFRNSICDIKEVVPSSDNFRGMSFNTSITDLIAMLSIGSMSISMA